MNFRYPFLTFLAAFAWLFGSFFVCVFLKEQYGINTMGIDLMVASLGFYVLMIIGMGLWAVAKGYDRSWGILAGLCGPIGWVILALYPHHPDIVRARSLLKEDPEKAQAMFATRKSSSAGSHSWSLVVLLILLAGASIFIGLST